MKSTVSTNVAQTDTVRTATLARATGRTCTMPARPGSWLALPADDTLRPHHESPVFSLLPRVGTGQNECPNVVSTAGRLANLAAASATSASPRPPRAAHRPAAAARPPQDAGVHLRPRLRPAHGRLPGSMG